MNYFAWLHSAVGHHNLLFSECAQVTHSLTVVFFSRTYINSSKGIGQGRRPSGGDCEGMHDPDGTSSTKHANVDACGRMYEVRIVKHPFSLVSCY